MSLWQTMKRLLFSLACSFTLLSAPAVQAAESVEKSDFLSIPVLYMTDRAAVSGGFDGQRKAEDEHSIYDLNFGTVNYSLKNSQSKPLSGRAAKLGWQPQNSKPKVSYATIPDSSSGTSSACLQFGKVLGEHLQKCESKDVFVILHGYNTTFAEAAQSAALLEYSLECPVLVYDWPSKGKVGQYNVDAGNNEWSQEHFNRFLEELLEVKQKTGAHFNLLAHSMGNRLAIRSAPVMAGKHIFDQMFLVDPDFDAETFVHYLSRYARNSKVQEAQSEPEKQAKVRILFSRKDRALPLSQFLFGGYTRLGQAADNMLLTLFNPPSLNDVKQRVGSLMKGGESGKPVTAKKPDWALKFEWIDFTVLDKGLLGHTIPYQLVADLWRSDSPGAGLALADSEEVKPNRISKFFGGVFHEDAHIASRLGTYKRVVPEAEAQTQPKLAQSGAVR